MSKRTDIWAAIIAISIMTLGWAGASLIDNTDRKCSARQVIDTHVVCRND